MYVLRYHAFLRYIPVNCEFQLSTSVNEKVRGAAGDNCQMFLSEPAASFNGIV